MRLVPLVGVFAAILIVLTAGCGRNGTTWTGIREVRPPANVPFGTVRSMQAAKPLAVVRATGGKLGDILMPAHPVADEITQKIADNRAYWNDYQSGLCEQPRIFESGTREAVEPTPVLAPPPLKPEPEIAPAVRLKHRDEFVNLQLRIAVLESRLAASGETGNQELTTKLEDAKERLRSLNAQCVAESVALPN